MLISADINDKHYGDKILYKDLHFTLEKSEKVGMIGRNGVGKSTLFAILTGSDNDYDGNVQKSRGTIIASTRQEHINQQNISVVDYILSELPKYEELKKVIDNFNSVNSPSNNQMNKYSDAINHFASLGFYEVEDSVKRQLLTYQITEKMAIMPIKNLSGGQKRFVELVKIAHSKADVVLIDEPTNHMDYVAKNMFIDWLNEAHNTAMLIITHDRDVLANVDRILEIKDQKCLSYKGNYDAYLKQNSTSTISSIQNYEVAQATIANLKKQIEYAKSRAPGYKGKSANNPWVVMQNRLKKELAEIESKINKPSFWIDQESLSHLHNKASTSYHKYKAKNIKISSVKDTSTAAQLPIISVSNLSLGYDKPLFSNMTFDLSEGQRLRIHGRNGTGKTSLIKTVLSVAADEKPIATVFSGKINVRPKLKIGIYEQEISNKYIDLTLYNAIERLYLDNNLPINEQLISRLMSDYLFDPISDSKLSLNTLSGGQKARFQLISMLCNNPQLLILDEPTNHLDLPSIEELETALLRYQGTILFVSHDTYFVNKFEYKEINIY